MAAGEGDAGSDRHPSIVPDWALEELSELRQSVYRLTRKEKLFAEFRSISSKVPIVKPHDPLYQDRPYGLPPREVDGIKHDIWELILFHVIEPEEAMKVSKVCSLFEHLLKGKILAASIPEVLLIGLEKRAIPFGAYADSPTNTFLKLRLLCKTAKQSVDSLLQKGRPKNKWRLDDDDDINENESNQRPHPNDDDGNENNESANEGADDDDGNDLGDGDEGEGDDDEIDECFEFSIFPKLALCVEGSRKWERRRVHKILTSLLQKNVPPGTFPLRKITLFETGDDIPHLRNSFQMLFQLIGSSVRSLKYGSSLDSEGTYNTLRRWIPLLPNLEALFVMIRIHEMFHFFQNNLEVVDRLATIEPFPHAPHLKRFKTGVVGLDLLHLREVFRSCPNIQGINFLNEPVGRLDQLPILQDLPIERLNSDISLTFLQLELTWPLKELHLLSLNNRNDTNIPSMILFRFLNQFKNTLKELMVLLNVRNTGGVMNLPNLMKLRWALRPDNKSLSFMQPLKSLEYFDVIMHGCNDIIGTKEQAFEFLKEEGNIPRLFPTLRKVRARRVSDMWGWERLWMR